MKRKKGFPVDGDFVFKKEKEKWPNYQPAKNLPDHFSYTQTAG